MNGAMGTLTLPPGTLAGAPYANTFAPAVQYSEIVRAKMYVVDCGSLSSRFNTYELRGDGTIRQKKFSVKGPALHVGIGLVQSKDGGRVWRLQTQTWVNWLKDAINFQGDPSVPLRIIATAGIRSKAGGQNNDHDLEELVEIIGRQVTELFGRNTRFEVLSPKEEARLEFEAVRYLAPVAHSDLRWGVVSCGGMSSQVSIASSAGRLTQFSLPMGCSSPQNGETLKRVKGVIDKYADEIASVRRWQAISSTCYAARSAKLAAKCGEDDQDPATVPVNSLLDTARDVMHSDESAAFPKRHRVAMGVLEAILSKASDGAEVEFRKTWDQDGRAHLGANVATGYFIKHGVLKEPEASWHPFGWFQKVFSPKPEAPLSAAVLAKNEGWWRVRR
jgi:hypothetical protein